jgi:hypothetical protein
MEDNTALVIQENSELMEKVLLEGDLSRLTPQERLKYYDVTCRSLGLNPTTRPFDYIKLNGKLTLYARKDATEQLRKNNGVSITALDKEWKDNLGLYIVTAKAQDKSGRTDAATGVVSTKGVAGENLANAIMKAETKAKRRVTLSICGLGFMDESEVQSVPDAKPVTVTTSGEVIDAVATVVGSAEQKEGAKEDTQKQDQKPEDDGLIVIWNGKDRRDPKAIISAKAVEWIKETFKGKDPFDNPVHTTNHLKVHFSVAKLADLSYEKATALVQHCEGKGDDLRWYKTEAPVEVHDHESSSGYAREYLDKIVAMWGMEDARIGNVTKYADLPNDKKAEMMEFLVASVGEDKSIKPDDIATIAGVLSA